MKVVALPNKNLAYSNRCYTKDVEGYHTIKDLPVLLEKYDTLSSNMIGMSSFIRDYLKVSCEEIVEIKKIDRRKCTTGSISLASLLFDKMHSSHEPFLVRQNSYNIKNSFAIISK